jgi:hypothetical protein
MRLDALADGTRAERRSCKARLAFTQEVKAAERAPATVASMVVETEREPLTVGELIRLWRTHRGLSQLELALDANLWDGVDPALLEPPINMLRLGCNPNGLPRFSSMTAACNAPLIHQLRRTSQDNADEALGRSSTRSSRTFHPSRLMHRSPSR